MNVKDKIVRILNLFKNCSVTRGTNVYDFFIIPTIRFNNGSRYFLTIEWLKWYVGIACD